MSERKSKQVDFAKKRRSQGRSLSVAVREVAALIQPLANQQGIDLRAHLNEASARSSEELRLLVERLKEPVVPLFIDDSAGRLDRIGSCVLVRLDSDLFAFTAAHVIRDVGSALLLAPSEGRGGKLLPLPPCTAHLNSSGRDSDLDVGVLVLSANELGPFRQRVFLASTEIDQDDQPDDQGLASFYFVLGYPASRTQVKISKAKRRIHQQSFQCSTSPVDAAEYLQEGMSQLNHMLLDFDHKEIEIGGRRVNPPQAPGSQWRGHISHLQRNEAVPARRDCTRIDAAPGL